MTPAPYLERIMIKLKVTADYANQAEVYAKGSTIEVDDDKAGWLLADSPGSFERIPAKKTPAKGARNAEK